VRIICCFRATIVALGGIELKPPLSPFEKGGGGDIKKALTIARQGFGIQGTEKSMGSEPKL